MERRIRAAEEEGDRIRHCYMAGEMESRILHSRQVQAVEYGGSVAGPGQGNRRNSAVGDTLAVVVVAHSHLEGIAAAGNHLLRHTEVGRLEGDNRTLRVMMFLSEREKKLCRVDESWSRERKNVMGVIVV